jgi:hypothetical protein
LDLPFRGKYEIEDTEVQVPLNSPRKQLAIPEKGDRESQVENFLVEQCNKVVLFPHQPVGNIMCIQALLRLSAHEVA